MSEKIEFSLDVPKDNLSPALDKASKKAIQLEGTLSTAVSVFAGNLLTKAFDSIIGGLGSLVDGFEEAIDGAARNEVAINNLNASLARAGNFSSAASQELINFAESLEKTTTLEAEAALEATSLLQSLTSLNVNGLQQGVKAAADFATVLNVDLQTATRLVAKAAEGNADAFSRYGIKVEEGSTKSETFARVLEKLSNNFGGAASNQLNTYTGSLQALEISYGQLLDPIGEVIVKNPIVIATFNAVRETIGELGKIISENNGQFKELVSDGLFATIAAAKALFDAMDGITRVSKGVINSIITIGNAIPLGLIEPLRLAYDGIVLLLQNIPLIGSQFKNITNPLEDFADSLRDKVVGGIDDVKNSITEDNIFSKLSEQTDAFGNKIIELSEKVQLSASSIKNSNASRVVNESETNAQVLAQRAEFNNQILLLEQQLQNEEKALADQIAIVEMDEGVVKNQAMIDAIYNQKLAESVAAYDGELEKNKLIKDAEAQRLANSVSLNKKIISDQKATSEKVLADKKLQIQFEQQLEASRISALQGFLGAGIALAKQGSIEQKALQIASATTATYTAANLAYQSPPGPPYTIPLVAATIAQGLANVAKIRSQKFADGGIVQGSSTVGDKIPVNVNSKEMILNQEQQANMFNIIKNGSFGGGQVVIQIDGRTIATAVRDQIRGGFSLA